MTVAALTVSSNNPFHAMKDLLSNALHQPTASRPTSAPELSSAASGLQNDTSLHLRTRPLKAASEENKENDKENENRTGSTTNSSTGAQATQAVIQRRRRQKRRSTGLVHVDMEVRNIL